MLKISNLNAGYGKLRILRNISMHIDEGELVTIIGANGAGKSTLLKTIAGLIKPTSGEIIFNNINLTKLSTEKIVKTGCALTPEYRQLFNTMTVRENILLGAYLQMKYKIKDFNEQIELDKIFQIFPKLKERQYQLAGTLSGGEQQMVAIARSLMTKPKLLMLDEPSMGLAPLVVKMIFNILKDLQKEKITILLIEQNARAALKIADRGYVMETGRFELEGAAEDLLDNNDVRRIYLGKDYKTIDER